MARNHYDTLGIARHATADEVRSSYRKIVLVHHPDRSSDPNSKPIFFAATEAYEVLSDPEKRRQYDGLVDVEAKRIAEEVAAAARRSKEQAKASKPTSTSRAAASPQAKPQQQSQTRPQRDPRQPDPRQPDSRQRDSRGADAGRRDRGQPAKPQPKATPAELSTAEEIQRLTKIFQSGRHAEAETKARMILRKDGRQPVPYAVLGDIARARGNVNEAAKMYAYAMQMDPKNQLYEKRYADVLNSSRVGGDSQRVKLEPADKQILVPMAGGFVVLLFAIYMALEPASPIFGFLPPISSWSLSSVVIMFLCGVTTGTALSLGNVVDRFGATSTNSMGKVSPTMALGCVAAVQFWFAAALYGLAGLVQRTWNYSTSRLLLSVAGVTALLSIAAGLSTYLRWDQVLIWGGNLTYLGAMCGWLVADAVR